MTWEAPTGRASAARVARPDTIAATRLAAVPTVAGPVQDQTSSARPQVDAGPAQDNPTATRPAAP